VSGYRIEPEEVEAALLAVGGVGDAAVVSVSDARERPVLAAVVSPTAGRPFDVEGTGRALSARLPAYAVPRLFVTTAEMPRTSRGKIDAARVRVLAQEELDRLAESAAGGGRPLTDPESGR
jgi:acyl-coenzyme A synthetase/AMP-(fatty) acid ligase